MNTCQTNLKTSLHNFLMTSSNPIDREKALDMLGVIDKSMDAAETGRSKLLEYKIKSGLKRPKTAQAGHNGLSRLNRFSTTYVEDYPEKAPIDTIATRPSSTQNLISRPSNKQEAQHDLHDSTVIHHDNFPTQTFTNNNAISDYTITTSYTKHYGMLPRSKTSIGVINHQQGKQVIRHVPPDRCATASGARCHNPHPKKEFLVWRFPRPQKPPKPQKTTRRLTTETNLMREEDGIDNESAQYDNGMVRITDNQFDKVMRGKCRSIYQNDYIGSGSNGASCYEDKYEPLYIHPVGSETKFTKNSTQRIDYDRPKTQATILNVPIDRYGCSTRKTHISTGIIPGVNNQTQLRNRTRTTYDEDVNDRAKVIYGQIVADIQSKIDFSKINNLRDIERAMLKCENESDRAQIARLLSKLNEPDNFKRKSFTRKPRYSSSSRLNWSSNWPGPLSY